MFIILKYLTHEEHIPFSGIIKFAIFPRKIEITLSEIGRKLDSFWDFGYTTSKVLEITQESQPKAYDQILEYLKP